MKLMRWISVIARRRIVMLGCLINSSFDSWVMIYIITIQYYLVWYTSSYFNRQIKSFTTIILRHSHSLAAYSSLLISQFLFNFLLSGTCSMSFIISFPSSYDLIKFSSLTFSSPISSSFTIFSFVFIFPFYLFRSFYLLYLLACPNWVGLSSAIRFTLLHTNAFFYGIAVE